MSADLQRCTACGLPSTYETIEFDEAGRCNICKNHDIKRAIDWNARRAELGRLIEKYRGKHSYDMIIPYSGGKDSVWTLYYLMKEFKVKPLVVQFDHMLFRPGLLANNERVFRKLGVEVHHFRPSWPLVKRIMKESFIRRGDFCLHCHLGVFSYPMQVALRYNTPLIFWGEPSSEYTTYSSYDVPEEVDEVRFDKFVNLGITGNDIAGMIKKDFDFDYRDLSPFIYPKAADLKALGVKSVCLGSYIPWDVRKQVEIIQRELGWKGDQVEGMPPSENYSKVECALQGVRDYAKLMKRGYGRVTQTMAIDRRNGRATKEQAEAIIDKYEGEKPASLDLFLEYTGLTEEEFNETLQRTAVPPHEPDFNLPKGEPLHDADQWYRD